MRFEWEALAAVFGIQVLAVAATMMLQWRDSFLRTRLGYLVSVAVGVLLATALFHLMPESIEVLGNRPAVWVLFGGTLLALFYFERLFSALTGHSVEPDADLDPKDRDCSEQQHHHGMPNSRPLNLIFGGMLHSFVDGASVATAFAADRRLGWVTSFAIALHEVPHRLGDFALLVHLHVPARRAIRLIVLLGLPALVGVGAVAMAGQRMHAVQWLLPISAASFLYIAMVNLMPELQSERRLGPVLLQLLCMTLGAAAVALVSRIPGS